MAEENLKPISKVSMIIGGLLAALNLVIGLIAYPRLPDKVPTHWNFAGEVDGWGSAFQGAFMLPLIMIGTYLLLVIVPKIDPKRKNYALMGKAYGMLLVGIMVFFTAINIGALGAALGYFENIPSLIQVGVGALFIMIGNYMGKIKHNYFMGIRTPWTLANEEVWYRTHRFAGPVWVSGGILFIVISFLPPSIMSKALVVIIAGLALMPVLYSFIIFRKLTKDE